VPYPIVPGHVSIGHLAEIRGTVTDIEGAPFHEGDLVTFLDVHETCGRCYECLVTKQTTRCPSRKVYGITYSANEGPLGGWADYIWMKPGVKLLRIPKGVDPISFIAGGCGLVTAVHAVERGDVRLGSSVAMLGAGAFILAAATLAVAGLGAPLGELTVSGPFDAAKLEGKLDLAIHGIDHRLLDLAAAGTGLDFGSTTIDATSQVQLAGTAVSATGRTRRIVEKMIASRRLAPRSRASRSRCATSASPQGSSVARSSFDVLQFRARG